MYDAYGVSYVYTNAKRRVGRARNRARRERDRGATIYRATLSFFFSCSVVVVHVARAVERETVGNNTAAELNITSLVGHVPFSDSSRRAPRGLMIIIRPCSFGRVRTNPHKGARRPRQTKTDCRRRNSGGDKTHRAKGFGPAVSAFAGTRAVLIKLRQ